MKIQIPHLAYTVNVKDIKKSKEDLIENTKAYVVYVDHYSCDLFIKKDLKPKDSPTVAHEIIHILQLISESRGIHFASEREHFGYLMQYLMNKILGYDYC